jgi:glycine cleavage system T protein
MRDQARVVIIGGGIFGTSVAYHLAAGGCTDIILVDKGELTSGSTFHSVGLVTQFRTSPSLMKVMNYTVNLFNKLKKDAGDALGWHQVGSLRLASSKERLKALQRDVSRAKAIGINASILSRGEVIRLCPYLSDEGLYGAVHVPDDGHIDPSAITFELAKQAKKMGAEINTNVRVTGIELSPKGEVTRVNTDQGQIKTECVVNAAGEWAPRIGEMVGIKMPMVPLMHQYLTTKPIPDHELPRDTPVVRDPDNLFYMREDVGAFLIGAFESNPKAWSVEGVPWEFTQELLNPEWELFEPVMERAMQRIPLLAEAEIVELINGPDAFTPDGQYVIGPVPGIHGFYIAAGGSINGIAGGGGIGKILSEWIIEGEPSIDTHEMNVRRFGPHYGDRNYLVEHCREVYRYYYHLRYPHDENEWGRPLRTSPFYPRLQELGAVFGEKNGWERVNYFQKDRPWRRAGADQQIWGWNRPAFFDQMGREHKAAREQAVVLDMTSFGKIELTGPGALAFLQNLAANDLDKPVGTITYTQFLNNNGGIESDVTITRLDEDTFRIISGTSFVSNDLGWIQMHMPRDGSVEVRDVTEDLGCLSLWGPNARQVLQAVSASDVSNDAFPYMTAQRINLNGMNIWAQRVSYAGELGWELYISPEHAVKVWDAIMEAGAEFGIQPAGYKALESLRIEKGYLYWSSDITPVDNPFEAGLGFCVDLDKGDFIGRDALVKIREQGVRRKLCAITMDAGCNLYGGESVYLQGRIIDRVRSGAYGYSIGKDIGLLYLPIEHATEGRELQVEVFGERLPAQVAMTPLVDPRGERLRA